MVLPAGGGMTFECKWVSAILILVQLGFAGGAHAQLRSNQPITPQRVDESINKAVRFLRESQKPDGGWSDFLNYPHGVTSLVTLALLNAGLEPEDRTVSRALDLLASQKLTKTYSVSLQTMALCAANPSKYAPQIRSNAVGLIKNQLRDGGWNYEVSDGPRGSGSDPSNSQFALLALHEAQRTGLRFKEPRIWEDVFTRAKSYWQNLQLDDGSFPYRDRSPRGSMTCAGIASLVIVGAQTDGRESAADQAVICCGADDGSRDGIQRGLDWLGANFKVRNNPNYPSNYHLYYMYALERVGRLTGQRYIGEHDWYREGAEYLVNNLQDPISGKFTERGIDGNEYTATAFALLFLSKGKRQIVVSRLQYVGSQRDDWNHHSAAIQHLTAHTEQAWKRDLSWQNVDIGRSRLEDLLETPVLFISGTKDARFTEREKQLLKAYVEQNGFLFVEGCNRNGCDGAEFEDYFRKLVVELFDQPLEPLPPDHPIWYAEARVDPGGLPAGDANIYGVQTCCRLGVVYVPYSLSCRWELNLPYGAKPDYPELVQSDLDTATLIGINVLAYATGKELKEKLQTVTILEEVQEDSLADRGVFVMPKLRHNAGADDAPKAVKNLIQWLNETNQFRMSDEKRLVAITNRNLEKYPVVFLHGRGELVLSQAEREALKEYLDNGGFLFADAICADSQFAESFRREMEIITGEELQRLEATHPLLEGTQFHGFDIRNVRMIDPDQSGESIITATRQILPQLEVYKVNQKVSVVFSPLDLSCSLESRHSMQCRGYVREDAARIGINVILYALLR